MTHALEFDLDRGVLGGRLVSARTVANVGTASVGTRRERLRFRHRADGRIEVLQSPELQLRDGTGDRILLHTFQGTWYAGRSDGLLAPLSEADTPHWLIRTVRDWSGGTGVVDDLPPGSYVAIVASDPGLDPIGLEVDWLMRTHAIVGRLAEEDVVHD